MTTTTSPGVSGIALYVPPFRVPLADWCAWTGAPAAKVESVVGRSFRVCGPNRSVYTMAANAVLRLIIRNNVDPRRVGFLGFGTESSTDNAAGAIVLKGMVDDALKQLGKPTLQRSCEVPEFKHACLGGVYAAKGGLRWLNCEGRGQLAIVVCADIAEYQRGSSGEQTQGAGAVALLLENDPELFEVDLAASGRSAAYRGLDFRKPFARHFMPGYASGSGRVHDFPVFNGKYSTACYVDAVNHALDDMFTRLEIQDRAGFYESTAAILFHRPYQHMPVQAMAAAMVWGLARDSRQRTQLEELCTQADVDVDQVIAQAHRSPDLFEWVERTSVERDPSPESSAVARWVRKTAWFQDFVRKKMTLGSDLVRDVGNLYTASLPAWIAATFEDALRSARPLAGQRILAIGYGSGDAAEALVLRVSPRWRGAAGRIAFAESLDGAIDLNQEQYEALHDGRSAGDLNDTPRGEFVITRIGQRNEPAHQDIGIEYYAYRA